MDYGSMSYNKLKLAFSRGKLDPYDAMDWYKRTRSNTNRNIRHIEKSDVPFYGDRPTFQPPSAIQSSEDLLHAIADLNRFNNSKYRTITERRKQRDKALETLHSRGIDFVTKENYKQYVEFMRWFFGNKLNRIYGSQEDIIEDFFREKWDRVSGYKNNADKKGALTKFAKALGEF